MAAQGYIGRAPGDSSVIVARQTFTPTGITTNFTFASGYPVGYVDAYLNGARLIEGSDYTATDGSVVGLTTHAQNGDVLELVVYKAFNVGDVTGAKNDFSVGGDLSVTGVSTFTGAITATGRITGAVTGDATGLTGTPDITIRNLTGVAATFTGVLSYDDVTNVDSVGFATFRSGINVQGAGSTTTTLNVSGVTTMTGDVNLGADFNIPDAITHVGDTNTTIRFPGNDTFTVETSGSEALRVDGGQRLLLGDTSSTTVNGVAAKLQVSNAGGESRIMTIRTEAGANGSGMHIAKSRNGAIVQDDDQIGGLFFIGHDGTDLATQAAQIVCHVDGTPGADDMPGRLVFATTADGASSVTERFRITSSGVKQVTNGNLNINSTYIDFSGDVSAPTTAAAIFRPADNTLAFSTANTERLRIDSSGRLLVTGGNTTTTVSGFRTNLQVAGTGADSASIMSEDLVIMQVLHSLSFINHVMHHLMEIQLFKMMIF